MNRDGVPITPDHDILIALKTNFDSFAKQYSLDIKDLKDGTGATLANHESRIKTMETKFEQTDVAKLADEVKKTAQVQHDSELQKKWAFGLAATVGGAIYFVAQQLIAQLHLFGR